MLMKELLNEIKATVIRTGDTFTLIGDIGQFKAGETVTIDQVRPTGEDIEIHLSNDNGLSDVFYLDKNDDFEELG
jgi:hypothetical protein